MELIPYSKMCLKTNFLKLIIGWDEFSNFEENSNIYNVICKQLQFVIGIATDEHPDFELL